MKSLREINGNLGSILNRTDGVLRRQNIFLFLCIVAMALMAAQLGLGFSQQALQESAKAQLQQMERARDELMFQILEANRSVKTLSERVASMQKQIDAAPSVTTDKMGKLSLSVPLDNEAKKTVAEKTDAPPPEKLVIPLKAASPHLAK